MKPLLYISASLFSDQGHSTHLANAFVKNLLAQGSFRLLHRDLAADPVPHLDATRFGAFSAAEADRTPQQQATATYSNQLIDEWRQAELVVIGLPMYNLGVPSTFKAYIDHIVRAGETFYYTENGPVGLLQDRKVYVIAARGGQYQDTALDTQTEYVKHILGLMGVNDVEFIYAEGLNMGDAVASDALKQAEDQLAEIAGRVLKAA